MQINGTQALQDDMSLINQCQLHRRAIRIIYHHLLQQQLHLIGPTGRIYR